MLTKGRDESCWTLPGCVPCLYILAKLWQNLSQKNADDDYSVTRNTKGNCVTF